MGSPASDGGGVAGEELSLSEEGESRYVAAMKGTGMKVGGRCLGGFASV